MTVDMAGPLDVAVRVWQEPMAHGNTHSKSGKQYSAPAPKKWPDTALVVDTESTTDQARARLRGFAISSSPRWTR